MTNQRKIEHEIEIDAPVETVWKALTDASELMRWFPLDARAEPGPGGIIWYSWGPPYEGKNRIEVWDPPRRLKLTDASIGGHHVVEAAKATGAAIEEPSARRVAMDFTLEAAAGGKTLLRLVHSGFGEGADWDEEFDATSRGWVHEFLGLRHYLEGHRGEDRRCVWARQKIELPREETWNRLMSSKGLNLEGLARGDSFDRVISTGDRLQGNVLLCKPPNDFCAIIANLNGSFFRVSNEYWSKPRPHAEPNLWLSTYGLLNHQALAIQASLTKLLARLFPAQIELPSLTP